MDERIFDDELMRRVHQRQRKKKKMPKWKRMLRKYWPPIRLGLLCLLLILVIVGVAKCASGGREETLATEPSTTVPTEAETEPPTTEPPTEEPTIPPVGGVIYLTFDDGPGSETPRLLEILDKYNAKATFFVVNTPFASTITQISNAGHGLENHPQQAQHPRQQSRRRRTERTTQYTAFIFTYSRQISTPEYNTLLHNII